MKKSKLLSIMALSVLLMPAFTSCGNDDGPENAGNAVLDIDGLRLTSIAGYFIEYDEKGRVVELEGNYEELEIDYSKSTLTIDDDEVVKIKFNGKGYKAELSGSWNDKYDNYQYKGSGSITYSYNGEGFLTSIKSKSKETEKDLNTGETTTWEGNSDATLKWNKGNLVKVSFSGVEIEDGEKDRWTEDYTYSYSSKDNLYRQFPYGMAEDFIDSSAVLASVGLFGKGPSELPSSCVSVYDDEDTYTETYSFGLNDDGSIDWEQCNYTTYNYGYGYINTRSVFDTNPVKKIKVRDLLLVRKSYSHK